MRRCSHARSLSSSRDGVALVIVLAFIVLLSILVVSFVTFSRLNRGATASYSRSIQAEEIAQGGMQDILSDLHQEIIAGSTVTSVGANTVYVPLSNTNAMPARLGYNLGYYGTDINGTSLPPTLVRVSRASQDANPGDFYPPLSTTVYTGTLPMNYASLANSSSNSINGRYVSASRWNKIALLTTNNTAATYIPPPFATNTPDWVYYTRSGRAVCTTSSLSAAPAANIKPSNNLTNTAPVIGRYAYAVYDESALIDINTAGYISAAGNAAGYATNVALPTVPATNNPAFIKQTLSAKSYLAYADLTQLPGLSSAQTSVIDPLIKWRNASVDLTTAATASTNYFQMVFNGAKSGFTSFQTSGSGTDSPILGRQDLINYFAKIDSAGTTYSQALPYLGTFSRAANAPSWRPTMNATAIPGYYGTSTFANLNPTPVAYKDAAETTASVNRDLPNVRYPTGTPAGTAITHYDDLGNATTYYVSAGDSVVRRRFSLAKLAWLTYKGPSADLATTDPLYNAGGTDAAIKACFGLVWEAQTSNWGALNQTYGDHPDRWRYAAATTTNVHIETLDEVANGSTATGYTGYREPNFFELLRAGILSGSLGQSPGPIPGGASPGVTTTYEGPLGFEFEKTSADATRHILQIGANIIDQFDSDSFPTAIYLQEFAATILESDLTYNTVFGDENLPGISRISRQTAQDPTYKVGSTTFNCMKFWNWPELWNIHQAPGVNVNMTTSGTPGYPYPAQIRIHAYGKSHQTEAYSSYYNGTSGSVDYDDSTTPISFYDSSATKITSGPTGAQASLIYVNEGTSTGTAASAYYTAPTFLQWASASTPTVFGWSAAPTSNSTAFSAGQTLALNLWFSPNYSLMPLMNSSSQPPSNLVQPSPDGLKTFQFAAFFGGEDPYVPDLSSHIPVAGGDISLFLIPETPISISGECQDASGHWHPYGFMARIDVSKMLSDTQQTYTLTGTQASPGPIINYYGTVGTGHAAEGGINLSRGAANSRPDPRTDRFSCSYTFLNGVTPLHAQDFHPQYVATANWPARSWGFVYSPAASVVPAGPTGGSTISEGAWSVNLQTATYTNSGKTYGAFYVDPDGVVRPGDGYREQVVIYTSSNTTTGDGHLTYLGNTTTASPTSTLSTTLAGTSTGSSQARRPSILNRPFRSVGELGYAFRDLPYKTIDFFSSSSADGALLDLFSITDEPTVTAGEVNPSNMPISSLVAIMSGSGKMAINDPPTSMPANFITQTDAISLATSLAAQMTALGPLNNRADLVSYLDLGISNLSGSGPTPVSAPVLNYRNKAYAEAPIRALANVTNTRTWNLLIDIIAQSGNMSPTAASLNDFVVQGERRYWLHIAIDRYTGKIIDQQLEPVYE